MSTPDDARFRPDDPTPDDYDVGEGYGDAPPPGWVVPRPYDAVELEDAPTTPRATRPAATGPEQPGARQRVIQRPAQPYPPLGFRSPSLGPPTPSGRERSTRSALIMAGALAVVLVTCVVAVIASRVSGGSTADPWVPPTSTHPDDITAQWMIEPDVLAAASDDAEFARTPDGAFTGDQLIVTEDAWVVAWEEDRTPAGLAGVDPADGTVLWERPLAEVLCASQPVDATLLCLAHDAGTWVYHRIDAATGADLTTVDTALDDVQTVHANSEALIAVGPADPAPHAQLTGLALDGTELWSFDVADHKQADLLFTHVYNSDGDPVLERPRWRDLDGGLVMLWSTPGVAVIDPLTGDTHVHYCRSATPQGDHYLCLDDVGLNRYTLDGTVTWTLPDVGLTVPEGRSDARPVALTEPTANQYEVVPLDWQTGEITGAATYRFAQQPGVWTGIVLPPSGYTLPDATILVGDTVIVGLDPDSAELAWSLPVDEIYLSDVVQIGDHAVLELGSVVTGIDLVTGEIAWTRYNTGDYLAEVDGMLISTGFRIGVLEPPTS